MRTAIVALIALSIALAGCTTGQGSASIYVKDAPTDDFAEIHVVFTEVRIHASGGEEDNESDDDSGWITLFENASGRDIDLLAASGDASAFLGEESLAAGNYTQIRIIVQSAYGIDHDGNEVAITVSSGTLKIIRPFEVVAGQESRITVDIDLDNSLHQQGNGAWRMTPVVGSTTVEVVEDSESGEDVAEEGEIVA